LEKFESVGKGVADGPTKGTEAESMKKSFGLVTDTGGTVLKVAVVKA
jgi:hypothetical protein